MNRCGFELNVLRLIRGSITHPVANLSRQSLCVYSNPAAPETKACVLGRQGPFIPSNSRLAKGPSDEWCFPPTGRRRCHRPLSRHLRCHLSFSLEQNRAAIFFFRPCHLDEMNDYREINKKGALYYILLLAINIKKATPKCIKAVIIDKLARRVKRLRLFWFVMHFFLSSTIICSCSQKQISFKKVLFFMERQTFPLRLVI